METLSDMNPILEIKAQSRKFEDGKGLRAYVLIIV
jgi:hypothetical protein